MLPFYGKRHFADVTKQRTLRWVIILAYLGGTNVITRVLIEGRWKGQEREYGRKKAEVRYWETGSCYMAGFEDEVRDYRPSHAGDFSKQKKARKWILSSEPPEGISSSDILTSAQGDWFWTSDLQNWWRINLCCLRSFVICSIGN